MTYSIGQSTFPEYRHPVYGIVTERNQTFLSEQVTQDGEVRIFRVPIEYSGYFSMQEPSRTGDAPPALLIAAHGHAQSCKGFIKNFAPLRDDNFLVVAPQAINHFYWKRGKVGFGWITRYMRERTLEHTLEYLGRTIDVVREQNPFDEQRVFMLGFSNGAAMAWRLAASGIVKPAGLVSCCGDLPDDVQEKMPQLNPFPALIVHGDDDESMRVERGREAERILTAGEFDVTSHFYPGGHEVPTEEWEHIFSWLRKKAQAQ